MIRLGPNIFQMRNIRDHDLLFPRIKLLVIAAKAYLEDNDFGNWRLRSIVQNTRHLSSFMSNWHDSFMNYGTGHKRALRIQMDHIFYQRVELLSIMLNSFAEGKPMGLHQRAALKNNVDYICEKLDGLQCVSRPNLHLVSQGGHPLSEDSPDILQHIPYDTAEKSKTHRPRQDRPS